MASAYRLIAVPGVVVRASDGAHIPFDPANRDYFDYQAWLADGNAPDPAPEPAPVTTISAAAFLARFAPAEEIAIQGAAQANPSIALGLTMGLAKGVINLVGDQTVTSWMQSLVTAGAITQDRMTAILTP